MRYIGYPGEADTETDGPNETEHEHGADQLDEVPDVMHGFDFDEFDPRFL